MSLFDLAGAALALYVVHAAITGAVYASAGPGVRRVSRERSPLYFWTVLAIYLGLAIALVAVF